MSAHLTDGEMVDLTNSILTSLFGCKNFERWKTLKKAFNFRAERQLMTWVLDTIDDVVSVDNQGDETVVISADTTVDDLDENVITSWGGVIDDGDDDTDSDVITIVTRDNMTLKVKSKDDNVAKKTISGKVTITDELKMPCTICAKVFSSRGNLRRHVRLHSKGKSFKCTVPNCHHLFARYDGLQSHMKNYHSQEKPYECKQCSRKFKMQTQLKSHEKKHSYNIYACSVCPKRKFPSLELVHRHFRRDHHWPVTPGSAGKVVTTTTSPSQVQPVGRQHLPPQKSSKEVAVTVGGAQHKEQPNQTLLCCSVCKLLTPDINIINTHNCKEVQSSQSSVIVTNQDRDINASIDVPTREMTYW